MKAVGKLAAALLFGPLSAAAVCAAAPPAPAPVSAEEAAQIRKELADLRPQVEQAYAQLQDAVRGYDRTRFDPGAVIEQVGRDPQKLFEWVRDNTDTLPYRGALRGAAGVLMERAGNSLDRSLLLAALLQGTGWEVRLANAKLSPDLANGLLAKLQKSSPRTEAVVDTPEAVKARQRVGALSAQLIKALGGSLADGSAEQARMATALTDHWWVQRREGGNWVDLDPSGIPARAPARTIALSARGPLAIPAADCQEVELRAVIESFKGNALRTEVVLKQTFRPADEAGRSINFSHFAGKAVADADAATGPGAAEKLKAALIQQDVYLPTLRIDGRPVTDASFTTTGEVDHDPKLGPAGKLAGSTNKAMGGMFGGLTGGGGNGGPAGVLTAEWIEYEIRVPGERPQIVRRDVFDLIGPAARAAGVKQAPALTDEQRLRRALMLVSQVQILIQPCELPASYVDYQSARRELEEKNVWLGLSSGQADTPAKLKALMGRLDFRDQTTPQVPVIRAAATPPGGRTFIDRPNVIHHRRWLEPGAGGAPEWIAYRAIDLAVTGAGSLAGPADAARRLVERGVAETLAEYLTLGPAARAGENTAAVFEKGVAPVVVRTAAELAAVKPALSPDAAARVSADLKSGNVAVVSVAAAQDRWTWWRVDPRTGRTIGVMDTGLNGTTERAELEAEVEQNNLITGNKLRYADYEGASPEEIAEWAKGNEVDRLAMKRLQGKILEYETRMKVANARLLRGFF